MAIIVYTQKPVDVEAVKFTGWSTNEVITRWLSGLEPTYIPQGYEHHMRKENEKDRSRGDTLDSAEPYFVITLATKRIRIDQGSWIVKSKDGTVRILSETDFKNEYAEKPVPVNNA